MAQPKQWKRDQLEDDAATARANFRTHRLAEAAAYRAEFAKYAGHFRTLIPRAGELRSKIIEPAWIASIINDADAFTALRYLAAPPISDDDLKTLGDIASLAPRTLLSRPQDVAEITNIIGRLLDPCRFPWIGKNRQPTAPELEAAITASAALVASQRIETDRRNTAKAEQEKAVADLFLSLGYKRVPAKSMTLITDAPDPGELCGQAKLGDKQGDIFLRLRDKRLVAIECKVSNSEVNSFKRLMNDSVSKATEWVRALGTNQVVPVAVLRGVYKTENLVSAQSNIALVWEHRLDDFKHFVPKA